MCGEIIKKYVRYMMYILCLCTFLNKKKYILILNGMNEQGFVVFVQKEKANLFRLANTYAFLALKILKLVVLGLLTLCSYQGAWSHAIR